MNNEDFITFADGNKITNKYIYMGGIFGTISKKSCVSDILCQSGDTRQYCDSVFYYSGYDSADAGQALFSKLGLRNVSDLYDHMVLGYQI